MSKTIFISYERDSSHELARYIHDYLADQLGLDVFLDVEDINGGRFDEIINQAILERQYFIVILTPSTLKSEWVRREIALALQAKKFIIPILANKFNFYQPIPPDVEEIRAFGGIEFDYKSPTDFFKRLRRGLELESETPIDSPLPTRTQMETKQKAPRKPRAKKPQWQDPKVAFIMTLLALLIGFLQVSFGSLTDLWDRLRPEPPPPSLAYLFVLDTSAEMSLEVNGVSRQEVALEAIRQIADAPLNTSQVWGGLRVMGGGDQCNQTELIARGRNIQADDFVAEVAKVVPDGVNAYEAGIRASFEDFTIRDAAESDLKVVFIILGSLDLDPCQDFDIPIALSSYKQIGISTTFCTFTLSENPSEFADFQQKMTTKGFGCVYNVDKPEEISRIAMGVMEELVLMEIGDIDIEGLYTPTPVIYLQETAIPIPSPNSLEILTEVAILPTPTNTPLPRTPTVSLTPTQTPSETITLDIVEVVKTLDAQSTAYVRATNIAGTSTQSRGQTLTIEAYTDTPTSTYTPTPNLTASIDIFTTQRALDETATQERWVILTVEAYTDTPTPTKINTPTNTPTATFTPTLTPREEAEQRARIPATTNDQWTPYTEEIDGVEMALVPAGCFMMGSDAEQQAFVESLGYSPDLDEEPAHEQCFEAPFWLDVYEVTQGQFAEFGGRKASTNIFEGENRPVEQITWFEARDYCELRGGRLPTEVEWEYAARGPDALIYPWGNKFVGENVVYSSNQTGAVGSLPSGVSWVGVLDLSGNVWEWVSSLYSIYPYNSRNENNFDKSDERAVRGGAWGNFPLLVRSAHRYGSNPNQVGSIGFRCARSLE